MDERKHRTIPHGAGTRPRSREYFKRLRVKLTAGMLLAFIAPILVLSVYFHFQLYYALKESGKLHLVSLAESQRNTIDLFLQERVLNILGLLHSSELGPSPSKSHMAHCLENLRRMSDAFVDVGFFDVKGVQIGYAGPYPHLQGRDYSTETWLTMLSRQERSYLISDIYTGFRNKPHLTIAVKQVIGGAPIIVRATLDPNELFLFLRSRSSEKGVESYIINRQGRYQVVDPAYGQPLQMSGYVPSERERTGVEEVPEGSDSILKAFARLKETGWILVARQPLSVAYARMYRALLIIVAATTLIVLIMAGAIYWTLRHLINQTEAATAAREELRYQLLHASKLASVGELAAGVAHEINNPLAVIGAVAGVIRDMLDPAFNLDHTPDRIVTELDHIDAAVLRARGITRQLLGFARKHEPLLVPTCVNTVMNDVISGIKERELALANIVLVRDFATDIPLLMLDRDHLGQVFLNLVNNAGDAIVASDREGGTITVSTRLDDRTVRITVSDTGVGMKPDEMQKIFLPFFTTKEVGKGTGLGLSVSLSIIESFGGTIEARSAPDAGSAVTVAFPVSSGGKVSEDKVSEVPEAAPVDGKALT